MQPIMSTLLAIGYGLFVANFLFGVSVRAGAFKAMRTRPIHHALYFCAMTGLLAAVAMAAISRSAMLFPLIVMAILALGISRFRGRGRGHAIWATLCLAAYTSILFW